ncbi:TIGR03617 family F420-dependent LLM class oxidoreductase [Vineibacter terrae]|uniref:TIGR03617 family F420-dependent LLM class oxidoreductase n=1 Tax=Vineibacter terrae TaxID=2586908 RepID=A0A5C8P9G8_9HYPH|nr:TIGR03617 family F420-dependent LLM class oxidoreductase [Vineibacter terrae]TXL70215.1 TIGR03617 family F420-dependent LLM class oxidoreductase [Vineibacter terrae]
MDFDVMTRATTWNQVADLARRTEATGFSGMLFTEGHQVPWMNIAAAALAAPSLHFSTGIAIAFARSPMITAQIAWELAQNTQGRFRLGLGSQVKAHITKRYGSTFDKPAPQMKDYVQAVKACLSAFRREGPLHHDGPYYKLSLLTEQWTPSRHEHEDVKVDISAVGPIMVRVAGEVADGVHVHPMHSMHYIKNRLLPGLAEGAGRAGRDVAKIDKIIPVIVAAGNTPEEQAVPIREAKTTLAFYGATPNYAFQFDDLGFTGLRDQLRDCLKTGDSERSQALITDEILQQFAVVARWDDVADRLIERYRGIASRLVIYLASHWREVDPKTLERWGEVARAVRKAG